MDINHTQDHSHLNETSTYPPTTITNTSTNPYPFYHPAPPLATSRYNRQLLIPSISLPGQDRISQSKILIIGLGGLGSPASLYLAGAGVGTLGLLDHDVVEVSNLHRQIVHRESSVAFSFNGVRGTGGTGEGMTKVASALRSCRELNSEVNYVPHEMQISNQNALEIIAEYDIVLDCTDNPATRYLISDCCVVLGKTLVSGAAQKLEGQIVVLNWPVYGHSDVSETGGVETGNEVVGRGPCYRCVFPHPPSPDMVKSCSEIGILGPVVGAIGTLMASEALRLIVKDGKEERKPTMTLYNAWPSDPRSMFRVIGLRGRRKDCVVCGEDEVLDEKGLVRITKDSILNGSMNYETWCGAVEDIKLLDEKERIDARGFIDKIGTSKTDKPVVVDVREQFEVELGPKIDGSINIPISRILRGHAGPNADKKVDELAQLAQDTADRSIYFICQRGNDSQVAAKKLMDRSSVNGGSDVSISSTRWIGDVKGGFRALDRLTQPG